MRIMLLFVCLFFIVSCTTQSDDSITIVDLDSENATPETIFDAPLDNASVNETVDIVVEANDEVLDEPEDSSTGDSAPYGLEIIEIKDVKFNPNSIIISAGTTVKWIHNDRFGNNENIIHQVGLYKKGELFNVRSNSLKYGESFNYTFNETGEYWYIDVVFVEKMRGDITVE